LSIFDPKFDYWRKPDTLSVRDLKALMIGVDPRQMSDYVVRNEDPNDSYGVPPDLSDEEMLIRSALMAEKLHACNQAENLNDLHIKTNELIPWLKTKGYTDLAAELDNNTIATDPSALVGVTANVHKPIQRSASQEAAILECIVRLGHDPKSLPTNPAGKPGVKAQVRRMLQAHPAFTATSAFNREWNRLRHEGTIADSN